MSAVAKRALGSCGRSGRRRPASPRYPIFGDTPGRARGEVRAGRGRGGRRERGGRGGGSARRSAGKRPGGEAMRRDEGTEERARARGGERASRRASAPAPPPSTPALRLPHPRSLARPPRSARRPVRSLAALPTSGPAPCASLLASVRLLSTAHRNGDGAMRASVVALGRNGASSDSAASRRRRDGPSAGGPSGDPAPAGAAVARADLPSPFLPVPRSH